MDGRTLARAIKSDSEIWRRRKVIILLAPGPAADASPGGGRNDISA